MSSAKRKIKHIYMRTRNNSKKGVEKVFGSKIHDVTTAAENVEEPEKGNPAVEKQQSQRTQLGKDNCRWQVVQMKTWSQDLKSKVVVLIIHNCVAAILSAGGMHRNVHPLKIQIPSCK
jgi:hypothetical protein